MGLSDEERLSGIYFAIREMNRKVKDWEDDRHADSGSLGRRVYGEIKSLVKKMWHDLLGKQSNGMHWVTGSSSGNTIERSPRTPWEMAIVSHLSDMSDEIDPSIITDSKRPDKPFDAVQYCDIGALVSNAPYGGTDLRYVFEIYQWIEQLIYFLRRYDDELVRNLSSLSETTSRLSGLCFEVFSGHEDYAKAYVLHEIIKMLYGPCYPYREEDWDAVTKIMSKHNLHHDFTELMKHEYKLSDIARQHVILVNAKSAAEKRAAKNPDTRHLWGDDPKLLRARLMALLALNHKIGEYQHIFKDIELQLKAAGLLSNAVRKAMKDCVVRFNEHENKENKQYDRSCNDHRLDAYGMGSYRLEEVMGVPSPKED